jgi:uncharacterized protein (DUF433 family)
MVAKKTKTSLIEQRMGAGGESSFVGASRIRVADVVRMIPWIECDDVVAGIIEQLPNLTAIEVRAAIDYWLTHKREIDELVAEEEALFRQMKSAR